MFRKVITLLLVVFIPVLCHAQTREKAALRNLDKHRWDKAFSSLKKSVLRDSANVPAFYVLSQYYFHRENPAHNLDSAYRYAVKALRTWNANPEEKKVRWARLPLDSARLVSLRENIEAAAFEIAQYQGLEESYIHFIESFPFARQKQTAIALRNTAAYKKAEEENSFQAFQSFVDKYPDAREVPQAQAKYERLLFDFFTSDQSLESFELFLQQHPETPYRHEAEQNIFQILTASGSTSSFIKFLKSYPDSRFARTASDLLYHIYAEDRAELPKALITDSLAAVLTAEKEYLVPFLSKGRYGFMTGSGVEMMPASAKNLDDAYLCGNVTEDVLVIEGKMVTRTGHELSAERGIVGLDDIGSGFLLVETASGKSVLHKSGMKPYPYPVLDAKILQGRMLALKTTRGWGVFSLSGKMIVTPGFSEIQDLGHVLSFSQEKTIRLSTIAHLAATVSAQENPFSAEFDEVKRSGENFWVRKGTHQGLLGPDFQTLVPLLEITLSPTFFGAYGVSERGYNTYNTFGESSEYFLSLEVREPWVSAKTAEGWILYDPLQRISKSIPYDTVMILGNFAAGKKGDNIEIHFQRNPNASLTIPVAQHLEFIPGKDTLSFLLVVHDKKSSVYDGAGNLLFTGNFDRIQYAGDGFFVVARKEKKALFDSAGKAVLPFEYDAVGSLADGHISLLRSMKFGLYDTRRKKLIKTAYDKNILRFSDGVYVAFQGSGFGFIDENNKALSGFVFNEVHPWTDSVALVKQDGLFHLYNVHTRQYVMTGISKYKPVRDTPEERKYIIKSKDQCGVVSNRRGIVIPVNFSDIVNVGSAEKPLYFTEKHVKEASLFVVIYYDDKGTIVRREVYEQDEYEHIYCND